MFGKNLGKLEEHAIFVLFMAIILIMLWHGIWGLLDNLQEYLNKRFAFRPMYFNGITILAVILIIGLYPQILEKL